MKNLAFQSLYSDESICYWCSTPRLHISIRRTYFLWTKHCNSLWITGRQLKRTGVFVYRLIELPFTARGWISLCRRTQECSALARVARLALKRVGCGQENQQQGESTSVLHDDPANTMLRMWKSLILYVAPHFTLESAFGRPFGVAARTLGARDVTPTDPRHWKCHHTEPFHTDPN